MKKSINALTTLLFYSMVFITTSCKQKNGLPQDLEWIEKGNLHNSVVSDWKNATEENRLATCAKFALTIKNNKGEIYQSNLEIMQDAIFLKSCIDEATKGDYVNNSKIAEIAALCLVLKNANIK